MTSVRHPAFHSEINLLLESTAIYQFMVYLAQVTNRCAGEDGSKSFPGKSFSDRVWAACVEKSELFLKSDQPILTSWG